MTNNKKENAIEGFLYIVAMTLLLIIIPILQDIGNDIWIKIILALLITIISYYLIKIIARYLNRKITLENFKVKITLMYTIYFAIYIAIRLTLKI